ncbi:hypothetical protein [Actinomadura sp. 7K507]|uniref:DoxX family protein n=1 Tax=Actinomadura sp. 7K507 TaxID=2530365 RepID=UPI001042C462|nr:hypothetical protein [Actinomadura sp. 7K507]TDC83944.1 hypothetical protein E1285_27765 [Actinomadura sp. 7K507]
MADSSRASRRLATLMAGMGALHLIAPKPFDALIPERLPGRPRTWTHLSGAAELACAAAVAYPRTRKAGALATAGLMAAVYPANVKMARDWRDKPLPMRAAAYGRLPLQAPLIGWALHVARESG